MKRPLILLQPMPETLQLYSPSGLIIPQFPEFLERVWSRITVSSISERSAIRELKGRKIPYYCPRTHIFQENKTVTGGALFRGYIFAALRNRYEIGWLSEYDPDYLVYIPERLEQQQQLVADLRFMQLACRLNEAKPFQWESALPQQHPRVFHDHNGYGFLQVQKCDQNVKLWFYFQIVKKILSFTVTQDEFRQFLGFVPIEVKNFL